MATLEQRADRGFTAMTTKLGPEWVRKADTVTLDMESLYLDVLGQQFGTYNQGLKALGLSHRDAPEYGFVVMTERPLTLRSAWVKRIRAAQKELEQ